MSTKYNRYFLEQKHKILPSKSKTLLHKKINIQSKFKNIIYIKKTLIKKLEMENVSEKVI